MARTKLKKPLDRVMATRLAVDMAIRFPELHDNTKTAEVLRDALEAIDTLMDLRNIIATLAALDDMPRSAVALYAEDEVA